MSERARRNLFRVLLAAEILVYLGWQLSHLEGFQWSTDEGIYLMRVRLMQQGYALYRDIWTDQLPGLIELLRVAFALCGTSVAVGRAVIVLLSAFGLLGTVALARQISGRSGALLVMPFLALAPNFFWLSRAMVSPDLPSISLGIVGLAMMGHYVRGHRTGWLVASGLACAIGIYIKATAILAIAPAGIWLIADWYRAPERDIRGLLKRAGLWGGALVLSFALALFFHDLPALWDQFVGTQVASSQMKLKIGPHALKILRYFGEDNWGLAALGIAGAVVALRKRNLEIGILFLWLFVSLFVLLVRSPLWPSHHLVVLLPPVALLAGAGISRLWESLMQRRFALREGLVLAAFLIYVLSFPGIVSADRALLKAPTYQSTLEAVDFLRARFPDGAVVMSDYHMIPFRAGCSVPPPLATVSKKRIQLGLLSSEELIRITQAGDVHAVLFWDEQLIRAVEYVDWVRGNWVMAFRWNYHEIYIPLAQGAIQHPHNALVGDSLRLRGYSLQSHALNPGERLVLTLYWQVLNPISCLYTGFVHLLTPDGRQVSQCDQLAWGERYPSTEWHVGETIADRYEIDLPDGLSSGGYLLSVGMYDQETKDRLMVQTPRGDTLEGGQIVLDVQPVVRWPAQYQRPDMEHSANVRLGDVGRLVGYDLVQGVSSLEVRLLWEALSAPDWPSYSVFVHLRRGNEIVAQHDGPPGQGQRPTVAWRMGEFIDDVHVLSLRDVGPGKYELVLGLYDPASGQRLPVYDASGSVSSSGEASLGMISIGGSR